jgi:hypothetical protein
MPTLRHRVSTGRRTPRPDAGQDAAGDRPVVELTDAVDRHSHRIAQTDYTAGLALDRGSYRALCGATVLPTSLFTVPGPRCPSCSR